MMQGPLKIVKSEKQIKKRTYFGKNNLIAQPTQL